MRQPPWKTFKLFKGVFLYPSDNLDKIRGKSFIYCAYSHDGTAFIPPRYENIIRIKDIDDISVDTMSCIETIQANSAGVSVTLVSKLEANNRLAIFLGLHSPKRNKERKIILHFDKSVPS